MKFLVYLLGVIGAVGSLVCSFSFSSNNGLILVVCIGVAIAIYLGYQKISNKRNWIIGGLCLDGALLFFPTTISCLSYLTSIVVLKYREVSVYDFQFQSGFVYFDQPITCALSFLVLFIPMFLLAAVAIEHKKYFLAIIALLPGVFIELLFTITPPWYFLSAFVLYVLILLIAALQKGPSLKKPMLLLSVGAMVITYLVFPLDSYRPSKYSLFSQSKLPLNSAGNDKDQYDISNQGDRHYRNSLEFVIRNNVKNTDFALTNFKIRSIAYDLYDDGKWESSHEQSENIWFLSNLNVIADVTKATRQNVEIKQISGSSLKNYTPYFITNEDLRYFGDHYEGNNPQNYEMIIPNDDFNAVLMANSPSAKDDLLKEIAMRNGTEQYLTTSLDRDKVDHDQLTAVPEETGEIIDTFLKQNAVSNNGNIFDYISQCNQALARNTTYTLTPGHDVQGDAVDYFLNVSKKGYCVHYASTLALMLRRGGFRARFAVGYQVPGSKNNVGSLVVKDSNAHAWVEIYDDYLGWIPVEATPTSNDNPNNPTDTITPSPTNEPSQTEPNTPSTPQNNDQQAPVKQEQLVIYTPVYYLVGLVIITWLFVMQSKVRHKYMFKGADSNNQRVCFEYYYLNKLNIDCSKIKELVDKARFSKYQLTDEEALYVHEFYWQQTKIYYQQLNIFKKILVKYILVRL